MGEEKKLGSLFTEEEAVALMRSSQTLEEWNANVAEVKRANGGGYPLWWWKTIVQSGLVEEIAERWGSDGQIHARAGPDRRRSCDPGEQRAPAQAVGEGSHQEEGELAVRVEYALWVNGLPHLLGSDLTPEAVDKMLMAHRGNPLDDMDEINALMPIATAAMPAWMTPYCPSEEKKD